MQPFDIFMILLLVVVIGLIIGLNIVSVVDKKLGNIEINLPPIKPTVIVKVDKGDKQYDIYVENGDNNNKLEKQSDKLVKESFDGTLNNESIEEFKPEQKVIKDFDKVTVNSDKVNSGQGNITNPDGQDIIDYGNYVCTKKVARQETMPKLKPLQDPKQIKKSSVPEPVPSACGNASLTNIHSHGIKLLAPFDVQKFHNQESADPAEYYRRYQPVVAQMEDEYLKGYNIENSTHRAKINEIGVIRLDDAGIYPTPSNYFTKPITQYQPKYDQL